jgi:hypothetical protein
MVRLSGNRRNQLPRRARAVAEQHSLSGYTDKLIEQLRSMASKGKG